MKKKKVTPSHRTIFKMDYDQLTNYYIEKTLTLLLNKLKNYGICL